MKKSEHKKYHPRCSCSHCQLNKGCNRPMDKKVRKQAKRRASKDFRRVEKELLRNEVAE